MSEEKITFGKMRDGEIPVTHSDFGAIGGIHLDITVDDHDHAHARDSLEVSLEMEETVGDIITAAPATNKRLGQLEQVSEQLLAACVDACSTMEALFCESEDDELVNRCEYSLTTRDKLQSAIAKAKEAGVRS